jgi:UDP-N-acetyl-D-mannosaminuronate dehydrogenase
MPNTVAVIELGHFGLPLAVAFGQTCHTMFIINIY